ncbi:hypothetical protein [Telmatospirillum sp. J64-1]|uniref:hypothetical protein n=1 Tax=Telmatospirillum sp. J64-1 TaxID=2502183 RepID=UPI00115D233E|nr:hypothetical protein [Telmatospirillum sp. J64-1]
MATAISHEDSLARVMRAVCDDKGLVLGMIDERKSLRSDLHFTTDQLRMLVRTLNAAHAEVELKLRGEDVEKCQTVGDLARITWEHIPEQYRVS